MRMRAAQVFLTAMLAGAPAADAQAIRAEAEAAREAGFGQGYRQAAVRAVVCRAQQALLRRLHQHALDPRLQRQVDARRTGHQAVELSQVLGAREVGRLAH